jgi:hypothetical protein
MTKAEKKAARHRRASREWMRRYRARKAEETDKNEPFKFVEPAASVILPQSQPKPAPALDVTAIIARVKAELAAPAADMPSTLPTVPRMDPFLFDPSTDRWRPSFWQEIDPNPAQIQIGFSPRYVRRNQPIASDGITAVRVAHDPGVTYSEDTGHIDIAAEQAQRDQEANRQTGDHRAWTGQEDNQ